MKALQFSVSVPQWIALDMVQEGTVTLEDMITHKFSLANFEKMIAVNLAKEQHRAMKTVVSYI